MRPMCGFTGGNCAGSGSYSAVLFADRSGRWASVGGWGVSYVEGQKVRLFYLTLFTLGSFRRLR